MLKGVKALIKRKANYFRKVRIAIEVQFGKYAFVAFDLFRYNICYSILAVSSTLQCEKVCSKVYAIRPKMVDHVNRRRLL